MPWEVYPTPCPINPIHAAVGRTGKVLFIAGSGNDASPAAFEASPQGVALWNVGGNSFSRPTVPNRPDGSKIDLFCVGHSFRANGRLLVSGGTKQYDPFWGLKDALAFDFTTESWIITSSMIQGRWYPTNVTLGSGRVLSLSGLDENGLLSVNPEIYGTNGGWNIFTNPTSGIPLYAHLFLLPNGKIFYTGAQLGGNNGLAPRVLTIPANFSQPITEQAVANWDPNADPNNSRDQAASVLIPPVQSEKVMVIGGGNGSNVATNKVTIFDCKPAIPTYTAGPPIAQARMHHLAVILPDRTVFVCGGSSQNENTGVAESLLDGEIYNPATNSWKTVGKPSIKGRVYHTVAVLLPDGSVAIAGGNPDRGIYEARIELYKPDYMAQPRPQINAVSAPTLSYNTEFIIYTPQANNIKWAHLVRPMATTHGMDTEQRLVDLPIRSAAGDSVSVRSPGRRQVAHPGYYMLFIVDKNNIPSVASWIQLL